MTLQLPDPIVTRLSNASAVDERALNASSVQRNFDKVAGAFPVGPENLYSSATYTTLPSGSDLPEGFEADYVTGGVVWRFKYLPSLSGTYPWHFVGGPPLHAEDATTTNTTSTTYQTTNAPSVTSPLAGDYLVDFGCRLYIQNPVGRSAEAAAHRNGTLIGVINSYQGAAGSVTLHATHQQRRVRASAGSAGHAYDLRFRSSNAADTATVEYRWISVLPIRVS